MIVVDADTAFRDRLASDLSEDGVAVRGMPSVEALRQEPPNAPTVVVFGPSVPADKAIAAFRELDDALGAMGGVLFVRDLDPTLMRDAIRAGLSDVLTPDASSDELQDAIARARSEVRSHLPEAASHEAGKQGKVITVFSTKGGCGKSLVAANVAVLLAQRDNTSVALVDLDLQSGDLAIMLQMMPALSLYDAAQNISRLDVEALSGYLTPHRSGVMLMAAPLEPSVAEAVSADAVTTVIGLLRTRFDYVIVDSPAFFTDQVLAAFDLSDEIVLVASMDVPSVKNLRLALSTLGQLGHGRDRIRTVLNRADSNVGLRTSEVEKSLATKIDVQIPSSRDVPLSVNQGTPLAEAKPRSPVVTALREIADAVAPAPARRATDEGGFSLFGRNKK